jgi:hypothetical protein
MGRSFTWELGFDFDMLPDPDDGTRTYLLNGFVSGADLASPMLIEREDSVAVHLFNVTPGALSSEYEVTSGTLTFFNALIASETAYPFNPSDPVIVGGDNPDRPPQEITPEILPPSLGVPATITIPDLGTTTNSELSTTFPGQPRPRWKLVDAQTFALDGIFTVTFQVIVQGPNGTKRFRVDPQMIIGGAG